MKHKKLETALYSTLGVVIVLGVVIAINIIASAFKVRVDMTADKLFTLSPGTKAILKKLDAPVEVRFYFSRSEKNLPTWAPNFARNVEDLLAEFEQHAGGNLIVKKFDPKPDSDAEDLAINDGIERQVTTDGNEFFLGVAVSLDPLRVTLPALVPARERLLEYDLIRAISRVLTTNKPVVGVMSPLPLFGQPMHPMMMQMGRQPQRPWVAITELQNDFTVRQIGMDAEKIDDDVRVLVVVQPRDISEKALFAIDQFVLRGGRLLALLDATCLVDRPPMGNPMQQMLPGGGSTLEPLLKAWGVSFENTKVVADLTFARELTFQEGGRPQLMPTWLFINPRGINQNDIATSQIDNLLFPAPGTFVGTPTDGLKKTVLVHSTKQSQLVDGISAQFGGQDIVDKFKPSGTEYELAIRLQGKFKTAFPDGKPGAAQSDGEKKDDKSADKKDKKEEKTPEKKSDWLKESKQETVVVLVGDSDFIYDNFCVRMLPMFGLAQPINGNLNFFQNLVEQLAGDSNLIAVRSRATIFRPFTRVQQKEAEAQQRFRNEIARLQAELEETQRQLNELQGKKEPGQRFFLSREQQEKIAEFRKKEAEARRNLKQVRKDLRREIDSLQNTVKWVNIAGMPLLVSVAGLLIAYIHRQRTKAQ